MKNLAFILSISLVSPWLMAQDFTLYLVRHAEKQKADNPSLTQCGEIRAQQLAQMLSLEKIQAIYSTSYNRTLETASPAAKTFGVGIKHYSPMSLDQLAVKLLSNKQNALIVGHSNTTPALGELLTGEKFDEINEDQYQFLYQIKVEGDQRLVSILKHPLTCRR